MQLIGRQFRIKANGSVKVSSRSGTSTVTFKIRYGGTGGAEFGNSGAITLATDNAERSWSVEGIVTVRGIGVSSSVWGHLTATVNNTSDSVALIGSSHIVNALPLVVMNVAKDLDLTVAVSNVADITLICNQVSIEQLN